MRRQIDRPKECFAFFKRTDKKLNKLAMFIHGFRGNYLTTWGELPELLHWEADKKQVFEDWDYVFLGYDTSAVKTYLDIANLVWTHWNLASKGSSPYDEQYQRLALFGHSLGTLGLRQALCATSKQPKLMLQALHSVTFFGTPINGSPWADAAEIVYDIGAALVPSSPQLRMLKAWTETARASTTWPDVTVVLGTDDKVVGYTNGELVSWEGDDKIISYTHFDHSELVKPSGWSSGVIDYVRSGLK
jgi:hypothetical protein